MSIEQTSVQAHINQNGPSIGDELPWQPKHNHQTYGEVQGFDARRHGFQDGMTTVVYYTEDCDPAEVVDRWLSENEDYIAQKSDLALHYKISEYGPEFREASAEMLGPFGDDTNGGGDTSYDECPLCGGSIKQSLPYHFRKVGCDD